MDLRVPSFASILLILISSFRAFAADISPDIRTDLQEFIDYISSDRLQPENCAPVLNEISQKLFDLPATYFDHNKSAQEATEAIQLSWKGRIALRNKLAEFVSQNKASSECVDATRDLLKTGRFIEDYIGNWMRWSQSGKLYGSATLAGDAPDLLVNPKYEGFTRDKGLRSGDIIISRYNQFSSAAFARIADVSGQFSHLGMVYVDEKTGQIFTIESFVESGVVIRPWESGHLKDGNIREVIFRYPDAEVAKKAARKIYDHIKAYEKENGKTVPYGYTMNLDEFERLYCAVVARLAYKLGTDGQLMIPLFPSDLSPDKLVMMRALGINAKYAFAPSDMDVESRFEVVAEWRDYAQIYDSHLKDFVLTKVFSWMENDGYTLHIPTQAKLMAQWVKTWRPLGFFDKDIAPDTPASFVETFKTIEWASQILYDQLKLRAQASWDKTGLPMTPKEMYSELDEIRGDDFSAYKSGEANTFHDLIRN